MSTSRRKTGSTSSTKKDESLDRDAIAELGESILKELNASTTNNTLVRWLSHQTARLIKEADDARAAGSPDVAERDATAREGILQLWSARSDWPQGWPPTSAVQVARLLDELPSVEAPTAWSPKNLLNQLTLIHYRILEMFLDVLTVTATEDETAEISTVDIAQSWLDRFGEALDENELLILQRVADTPRRMEDRLGWCMTDLTRFPVGNSEPEPEPEPEPERDEPVDRDRELARAIISMADTYRDLIVRLLSDGSTDEPGDG